MRSLYITLHACERYLERVMNRKRPFSKKQIWEAQQRLKNQLGRARITRLKFGNRKSAVVYELDDCYATVCGNSIVTVRSIQMVEEKEWLAKMLALEKKSRKPKGAGYRSRPKSKRPKRPRR